MRPLKLEISAFCSYSHRTVIDMEKLGDSGIYLITGDTGAGKTTIFDAITYALYGMPSGSNRDASMLRSMYAPDHITTYVKLTFSHKDEIYTIERNPSQSRARKEGGKTANISAGADLYKIVDGEEKNIASGTTKVNESVIGILGIDHKQFCHIAMIAQGDFVKLLTARSEERQKIFRKLFDTQMYDSIQNILKEKETTAKKEYFSVRDSIKQHISNASCQESSPFFEEFSAARENENAPQEAVEAIKKIIGADIEYNTSLEQKINDIIAETTALGKAQGEAEKILTAKKSLRASEIELKEKTKLLEELNKALSKKKEKTPEAERLAQEIAELKAVLSDYSNREKERRQLEAVTEKLESDCTSLTEAKEKLNNINSESEKITAELKTLENAGEQRARLELKKSEAMMRKRNLTELQSVLAELEKLIAERLKTEEKYMLSRQNTTKAENDYSCIRNAFLDAQAGIIAQTLEDGLPCRVCGSVHHPTPAVMPDDAPTQEQLDNAEEKMKTARENQDRASRQAAEIKEKCQSKETRAEELLNLLGIDSEPCTAKTPAEAAMYECEQLTAELESRIAKEENKIKRKEELAKLKETTEACEAHTREDISQLEKQIAAGRTQKNAHISNISTLSEKLAHATLDEAQAAISARQLEKQRLEDEITAAQEQYNNCCKDIADLQGGIRTLSDVLKNSADIDTEKDYASLISELESQRVALQSRKDEITARITLNTEAAKKSEKLISDIVPLIRKCECLSNLNDAVRGNISGQDKLSLEAYVQAVYFERIIIHANYRLDVMTGGQYALRRRQTASSKSAKCGLDLEIIDYFNGTARDVGSLSGGESFKASLALALGLADEIQSRTGGVRLDTMFIDEGFGSLDGTSLDQAMEALAQLSGSNRLVGIISHVEELKRRIDKKIIVTKAKPSDADASYGTEVKIEV